VASRIVLARVSPLPPSLPNAACPVCLAEATLYHERTERDTIHVVTLWCPERHMWEVRWSVAA
jgi:hypothetical protein